MERRSFLKRLGILAGASLIPDKLLSATEFVEKKVPAEIGNTPYNFTDHMGVQRKIYIITSAASYKTVSYLMEMDGNYKDEYTLENNQKLII